MRLAEGVGAVLIVGLGAIHVGMITYAEFDKCRPEAIGAGPGAIPYWVESDGEVGSSHARFDKAYIAASDSLDARPDANVRIRGEWRMAWRLALTNLPCTPPDTTTTPDPEPPDTTEVPSDTVPEDTTTAPDTTASSSPGPLPRRGWPSEPIAPDSLTFDYLDADRGVVVWWWGGDATGWVLRGGNNTTNEVWEPAMFQRGVTGHTVFLSGIGGGGMHLDGPGSYWTCVDAWYDPTQPVNDYLDPEAAAPDRMLPDTTAAGAQKVTRCGPFDYPNPAMPVPSYDYRVEQASGALTYGQEPLEPTTLRAGEAVRLSLIRIDSCGWALPDSPDACPGQPLPDSVVFVVNGERVREQVHPYTFPGGADPAWVVPDSGPVSFGWQVFGAGAAGGMIEFPVRSP